MHPDPTPDPDDDALFVQARDADEDRAWDAIGQLQQRATPAIVARARAYCASTDPQVRRVGVDIFAQIGIPQTTFHETVIGCLIPMLATESDPAVLASVASALGHRRDPRAIAVVLPFRDHPDAYVRHGVVMALMAHDDDDAIAALITLSGDESALVRDWATFGLGSQSDRDTPAIRTALAARLDDPDDGAREEALRGLAQRRDPRVLEPLIAALRSPTVSRLVLETAVALGDPRLLPTLRSLRVGLAAPDDILEDAIAACDVPSP